MGHYLPKSEDMPLCLDFGKLYQHQSQFSDAGLSPQVKLSLRDYRTSGKGPSSDAIWSKELAMPDKLDCVCHLKVSIRSGREAGGGVPTKSFWQGDL